MTGHTGESVDFFQDPGGVSTERQRSIARELIRHDPALTPSRRRSIANAALIQRLRRALYEVWTSGTPVDRSEHPTLDHDSGLAFLPGEVTNG